MKKTLFRITLIYVMFLVLLSVGLYRFAFSGRIYEKENGRELVLLNEIRQLSSDNTAQKAIDEMEVCLRNKDLSENRAVVIRLISMFWIVGLLYTVTLLAYVFYKVLAPFERLQRYAEDIAGGNLDVELGYERTNFFGAFTWAFDHMRKELQYAKKKESEAIEANKVIIASLSHDIKTPIASIRAYSEALEANLDAKYEKRQRYVATIMKKCDEVTALVNDLVLHSLSELEKLEIKMTEIAIDSVIRQTVQELEFDNLKLVEPLCPAMVMGDARRIEQILENLINNARKYAPGQPVRVYCESKDGRYHVHVRDFGAGIEPEDMPFITQKFYRGKNVGEMPGSGLGLYIVDYLLKEMGGEMTLQNTRQGLDVEFSFPILQSFSS